MEETDNEVSKTSTTVPSTTVRQTTTITSPYLCKVFGAPALYSYYGAVYVHHAEYSLDAMQKVDQLIEIKKIFV
jgi:hypothetical protein